MLTTLIYLIFGTWPAEYIADYTIDSINLTFCYPLNKQYYQGSIQQAQLLYKLCAQDSEDQLEVYGTHYNKIFNYLLKIEQTSKQHGI